MTALRYRIADRAAEFEAIHRLNYRTFVEEIPQHPPHPSRRLVDRFHDGNVYAICLAGDELIGMVAGRCQRPFSLDSKVPDLDSHLPSHHKAVEIRLLAVQPAWRHQRVFARLVAELGRHFRSLGCDLAIISGTVRQLRLYEHMGFRHFGPQVGSPDALYQPMYLTLQAWQANPLADPEPPEPQLVRFLPGPVEVSPLVQQAFCSRPVSHRSRGFAQQLARVRTNLCNLTHASHAAVLVGTGTLANDAIAAQIRYRGEAGLVLANGEFGERLAAHARGWGLPHDVVRTPWGQPLDWKALHRTVTQARPAWVWAVLSETSTGMTNSVARLRALSEHCGAAICLDAISAVGLMPVDLRGIWLASAVSGKGLAAYAGLAIVFHGQLAPAGALPRYLDLAGHEAADGIPFTHSSNLVSALDCALTSVSWNARFQRVAALDRDLRSRLRAHGFAPLAPDDLATPGIITLPLPPGRHTRQIAMAMEDHGIALGHESTYLRERNWLQICLMGNVDAPTLERIPSLLAKCLGHHPLPETLLAPHPASALTAADSARSALTQ